MFKRSSLTKCRRVLKGAVALYEKKGKKLSESDRQKIEEELYGLDQAILRKDREEANRRVPRVKAFVKTHFQKTFFEQAGELIIAVAVAICFAFVIREVWFELYEVPTGSMRPTIEELDRLVVSKTTFGIHIPSVKKQLFYNDDLIKRQGIIVFTVAGMDVADSDTVYFYLFPGKKRFIKRCLGKPGDTLYFYGGRIYGIDKQGEPLKELYDEAILHDLKIEKIDHIPYIEMGGKVALETPLGRGIFAKAIFNQMNLPVGELSFRREGKFDGLFYNGKEWIKDDPKALNSPHTTPVSYSDLWGIGNFAMARLLTAKEIKSFHNETVEGATLYLELKHTPNLTYPQPEMRYGESGLIYPQMTPFATFVPLKQEHLNAIQKALFTARFHVKNGKAIRYNEGRTSQREFEFAITFKDVPDGTYEFYDGVGYKVHRGGFLTKLAEDHPLYSKTPENIQKLFNLGIGFHIAFEPRAAHQPYTPQRFAYYRDGDLYLMGHPILKKEDPTLISFIQQEKEKATESKHPYVAFIDHGAPLKEGKLDVEFIKAFGLKLPDDGVLALGDNYAMSADSRDFGFVPVFNLRGAPAFIFWPFTSRVGRLPQAHTSWLTIPNMVIWSLALAILVLAYLYHRRRMQKPLFKKLHK